MFFFNKNQKFGEKIKFTTNQKKYFVCHNIETKKKRSVSIPIQFYIEQKTKFYEKKEKKSNEIYKIAYRQFKYLLFVMLFERF